MAGTPEPALAALERSLVLKPGVPMVISARGHALQALGRIDQAIACFAEVAALLPDSPKAKEDLANARRAKG